MCVFGVCWGTAAPSRLADICAVCITRVTVCTVRADCVAVIVAGVSGSVYWGLVAPSRLADTCAVCCMCCSFHCCTVSADGVAVTAAGVVRVV